MMMTDSSVMMVYFGLAMLMAILLVVVLVCSNIHIRRLHQQLDAAHETIRYNELVNRQLRQRCDRLKKDLAKYETAEEK